MAFTDAGMRDLEGIKQTNMKIDASKSRMCLVTP